MGAGRSGGYGKDSKWPARPEPFENMSEEPGF